MKSILVFLTIVFSFLFCGRSTAQQRKYTSSSKAAIKHYDDALHYYDVKQNDKAIDELKTAIEKDPQFVEAYILLASVQEDSRQFTDAVESYKKSFQIKPDFFPYNYLRCANLEQKTCDYNSALLHYNHYLSYANLPKERIAVTQKKIEDCNFAIAAMEHPVPFDPHNLGNGVNSADAEYYFSFTIDQKNLIFTRDIKDNESTFGHQEDFFVSNLQDSVWQNAKHLDKPLNTTDNEGAPSLSADGKLLFFTACNRTDGQGSCDIWLSQQQSGNWSKPINLGPPVNTSLFESQPSFSSDGKTLYFTRRNKRSGRDNTDIYYSVFNSDRTWSDPKPLSDSINTSGNEESAFIHPDNQTLYFSSDGHTGMGGLDIYMSRKDSSGNWGKAINLGYPINTCNDENSFVVSADGKHAYFSSDRKGGFGKLDIYVFDLYKEARPVLTSYVKAKVFDAATKEPLQADFQIIDIESGKIVVENTTDRTEGEFLASLPSGRNYLLNINKPGYLFYSDHFECSNITDKQQAYILAVPLKKPEIGQSVVLNNIFFDVNKFDLKPESYTELEKLISFLHANPTVKIEISGHTDNTGDKNLNRLLSDNRARTVYNYLISKGIEQSRLSFKGYGDSVPVASNETDEGRTKNRRTEFQITGK
jgi:outer membrane protein OmpA-like peptidoglycan-associated protein